MDDDCYDGNLFRVRLTDTGRIANTLCAKGNLASLKRSSMQKNRYPSSESIGGSVSSKQQDEVQPFASMLAAAKFDVTHYDFHYEDRVLEFCNTVSTSQHLAHATNRVLHAEYSGRHDLTKNEDIAFREIAVARERESVGLVSQYLDVQEAHQRSQIEKESSDFHTFCCTYEPQWRHSAKLAAERRELVEEASMYKRRWYEEEVDGFFMATRFSEQDERPRGLAPYAAPHTAPAPAPAPTRQSEAPPPPLFVDAYNPAAQPKYTPTPAVTTASPSGNGNTSSRYKLPPNLQNVSHGVQGASRTVHGVHAPAARTTYGHAPSSGTQYGIPTHLNQSGYSAGAGSSYSAPNHLSANTWNSNPPPPQQQQRYGSNPPPQAYGSNPPPQAYNAAYSRPQQPSVTTHQHGPPPPQQNQYGARRL